MTASEASLKTGAGEMSCSQASLPMSKSGQECTSGLERTGMLPAPQGHRSCLFAGTSVLESHNSFGCTFSNDGSKNEREANHTLACCRLLSRPCITSANQTYRNARRRHDLKLLSI